MSTDTEFQRAWAQRIQEAQDEPIERINGHDFNRIRYGGEPQPLPYPSCPDCAVARGQLHVDGCDQEACACCGAQRISCLCSRED